MGLFASAGSVARVAFPIMTGIIAQSHSTDAVFISIAVMLSITLGILLAFHTDFRKAIH